MPFENVSAQRFKSELLRSIKALGEKELNVHLREPNKLTKRTNLFLGASGKIGGWEAKKNRKSCLLAKLHKQLYPNLGEFPIPGDLAEEYESVTDGEDGLVWFETMQVDCIFLPYRRVRLKKGPDYPIAWTYDWVIEVENTFEEFAFTLRGLLDINCNKRMGIFFSDKAIGNPEMLTEIFKPVWRLYQQADFEEAPIKLPSHLYALVFPDTFTTTSEYCGKAILAEWNHRDSFFARSANSL